ncbi:hypothetical protein [Streptomyces aurantiogriseus]|uniref:Integral membrane protein n=1 Tax=Streptomyces aurantiogriseus TaxID=66870 RepID=A0A918CA48_9ACTN|nr:hypothetical protein [Streptomyces aurantiogriseus]GGR11214.1 hypothetical protein GCM10010251_29220 [Streptomyces aurantiogriseus]
MAHGTDALLVGARRGTSAAAPGLSWQRRGEWLLAAVAVAFTVAQLVLVRPSLGLGWDETVYVSQSSAQAPPAFFSAPRARGVALLVAPVTSWSTSTELLRVYLAVLSGLGLYLALRVWRGYFPARVLAAAGALFASLWVTLFYGPAAMPNYWVALGALACVGCCLRAAADHRDRAALGGVAVGAALMAWMRPTDAVWISLPLLVWMAAGRRMRLALVLLAGLATGIGQWVIEAHLAYGGLTQRLSEGSRIQGGLGWNIAVDDQLRSLIGRTLCRPCTGSLPHPAVMAWWFVLPLLAAVGLTVAVRARRTGPTGLLLACATTAAVPYLFMIGYAAPRFLLPAYLLLAIPVADALFHLVTSASGRWRPAALVVLALGLAGHLAVQYVVLDRTVDRTTADRRNWSRTAGHLHRLGVRPPCLLTGANAVPLAFYTGCSSANPGGHDANTTVAGILSTARRIPTAALSRPGVPPPPYARDWRTHPSAGLDLHIAPPPRVNGPA